MIAADEYTRFLSAEYLQDYVPGGGAAVKFVVPTDDDTAAAFSSALLAESLKTGLCRVAHRFGRDAGSSHGPSVLRRRPTGRLDNLGAPSRSPRHDRRRLPGPAAFTWLVD